MNSQTTQDASELAVTLRDGSQVLIRPICASDKPLVAAAYDRLSPESRRRRFLVVQSRLSEEDLRYLTEVDHRRHEALIALDAETGEAVGDARYVRLPGDREAAEVATVVADGWHGRGLATALLTELTQRARANGLSRYTAVVSACRSDGIFEQQGPSSPVSSSVRAPRHGAFSTTGRNEPVPCYAARLGLVPSERSAGSRAGWLPFGILRVPQHTNHGGPDGNRNREMV